MKNNTQTTAKGLKAFNTLYMFGIAFAVIKVLDYLEWTFHLVTEWALPEEPFFSKVNIANGNADLSVTTYLVFALAYILVFGFIILGLYQLNRTTKLLADKPIFQKEVGTAFRKAGKSFLAFAFGTLCIDIAYLTLAHTSNRIMDLASTELLVFLILGYLMFFLADIFKEGITLQAENDLTI